MARENDAEGAGFDLDALGGEGAAIPEEDSPFDPSSQACLFVRVHVLDGGGFRPLAGVLCRLRGPLPGAALSVELPTDGEGELLLEGCPEGAYLLLAQGQQCLVHTLLPIDLEEEPVPFGAVLSSSLPASL
jgi:hypothetical protein